MTKDNGFEQFAKILDNKKPGKKPPAFPWQELALRVIKELSVPNFKRNSVFKAAKERTKGEIETALNDTKELCKTGEKWKYFFKILACDEEEKNKG